MGSKAAALNSGLGDVLLARSAGHRRFLDLCTGSGAVAAYVAERSRIEVVAGDLQHFAVALAASVVRRTVPDDGAAIAESWLSAADELAPVRPSRLTASDVADARTRCEASTKGFVRRHYGGHYFSPSQADRLDAMIHSLPAADGPARLLTLAATIRAASTCCATTGHAGQPLQPNDLALRHISARWAYDPVEVARLDLVRSAPRHARVAGSAAVQNAALAVTGVQERDLVFLDPPYAPVQYSRLYHLLEAIAIGGYPEVQGVGRAPALLLRPKSELSTRAAGQHLRRMSRAIVDAGATLVMTFPSDDRGLGVTGGELVADLRASARVETAASATLASTLGGGRRRVSRQPQDELLIVATAA